MIAVTGASGHLGKATLNFLLKLTPATNLIAIARNADKVADLAEKGIEVRIADYENPSSLELAFAGVERLLLVSSSDLGDKRVTHHINVVEAAKKANVKHLFYTSFANPTLDSLFSAVIDHKKSEDYIVASGLNYTMLRNNLYMDAVVNFVGNLNESDTIYYPAGNGKLSFASRIDMAEATANIVVNEKNVNTAYNYSSPISYTFEDIATAAGKSLAKSIKYVDVPVEAMQAELAKMQYPEPVINLLSGIANATRANEFDLPSTDLENHLGRKAQSLEEFFSAVYAK